MEYNQNRVGNATISNYHSSLIEEQQSCQYETNETVPVKYPVFQSNQNFNYSCSDFVNEYAQPQMNRLTSNYDMNRSHIVSRNLQGSSSGFEKQAVNGEKSETFQNCEYNNVDEVSIEPYVPSLQFSQIVRGYSGFKEQRVLETGGYVERDCAALHEEINKISNYNHDLRVIPKPKRRRTVFEPYQIHRLQHEFDREMYMVGTKRKTLSKELNLTEKQIKVWFQNKRMKQKRDYNRKLRHSFCGRLQEDPACCKNISNYL